jgi:hypothetical protein
MKLVIVSHFFAAFCYQKVRTYGNLVASEQWYEPDVSLATPEANSTPNRYTKYMRKYQDGARRTSQQRVAILVLAMSERYLVPATPG